MKGFALNTLKALCLVFVAVLSSCGKDYYDVIPQRSPAVAEINLAGVAAEDNGELKALFKQMPFAGGVDLSCPAYAFITPSGYYGIVFAVADDNEIAKSVAASKTVTRKSEEWGLNWAVWHDAWQLAWNDDALVVIGPFVETGREALRTMISAMFNSSDGVSKGDLFAKLDGIDGSVKVVARLSSVPEIVRKLIAIPIADEADADSVIVLSSVAFADGSVSVKNELEMSGGGSPAASPVVKPYTGTFDSQVFNASAIAVVVSGIRGSALAKRVDSDKELHTLLSSAGGANLLADVKNFDGDAAMSVYQSSSGKSFSCDMTATVKTATGEAVRTYRSADARKESGKSLQPVPKGMLCYAEVYGDKLSELPAVAALQEGAITRFLKWCGRITFAARDASHSELHFYEDKKRGDIQ